MRYFDYKDTGLFGRPSATAAWGGIASSRPGLGRTPLTDKIAVRAGYQYNTNPIPTTGTLFNVQAPAITQHLITCGSTMAISDSVSLVGGILDLAAGLDQRACPRGDGDRREDRRGSADAAVQHAVPLRRRPEAKAVLHGGGGRVDGARAAGRRRDDAHPAVTRRAAFREERGPQECQSRSPALRPAVFFSGGSIWRAEFDGHVVQLAGEAERYW